MLITMRSNKSTSVLQRLMLIGLTSLIKYSLGSAEPKHTLKVASDLSPEFLVKFGGNGRYARYKGFAKDFIEELTGVLGYQYDIILPPEHKSSRGNTTGEDWDWMFEALIRHEADLAFGNTEVTAERSQIVDFSSSVLSSRFSVLYSTGNDSGWTDNHDNGDTVSSVWQVFRPFPATVWIPFAIVAVLYIALVNIHNIPTNRMRFLPHRNLIYSKKIGKILFVAWLLFLLTSYVSIYCAQKVIKAAEELHSKPETFVDMASRKDVKFGWLARGPVERFFLNTGNELYQRMYMKNVGRNWITSDAEGVNKVLGDDNGNFAYITDSLTAEAKSRLDCSLLRLPQEIGPIRLIAVATPIGSPLRERINQAVLLLSEQGTIESLRNRWFPNSSGGKCTSTSVARRQHAIANGSVQEMSPVFVLAVVGLFLVTVVGIVEIQLLRKRQKSFPPPKPKPPRQRHRQHQHQHQQQMELIPKFNLETV